MTVTLLCEHVAVAVAVRLELMTWLIRFCIKRKETFAKTIELEIHKMLIVWHSVLLDETKWWCRWNMISLRLIIFRQKVFPQRFYGKTGGNVCARQCDGRLGWAILSFWCFRSYQNWSLSESDWRQLSVLALANIRIYSLSRGRFLCSIERGSERYRKHYNNVLKALVYRWHDYIATNVRGYP